MSSFGNNVLYILKITNMSVQVLKLVISDKPAMDIFYEAMDRVR